MATKTKAGQKTFKCKVPGCGQTFKTAAALGSHMRYKHATVGPQSSARRGAHPEGRIADLLGEIRGEVQQLWEERQREYARAEQALQALGQVVGSLQSPDTELAPLLEQLQPSPEREVEPAGADSP